MQRALSLKPWPLKFWLLLLVAAVVVPLSTLTGFVVWQARGAVRARGGGRRVARAEAGRAAGGAGGDAALSRGVAGPRLGAGAGRGPAAAPGQGQRHRGGRGIPTGRD